MVRSAREKQARIIATARELAEMNGDQARSVAIDFARLTRDGRQVKDGKDAQFWWCVVLELHKLQGKVRLDTGTRYSG